MISEQLHQEVPLSFFQGAWHNSFNDTEMVILNGNYWLESGSGHHHYSRSTTYYLKFNDGLWTFGSHQMDISQSNETTICWTPEKGASGPTIIWKRRPLRTQLVNMIRKFYRYSVDPAEFGLVAKPKVLAGTWMNSVTDETLQVEEDLENSYHLPLGLKETEDGWTYELLDTAHTPPQSWILSLACSSPDCLCWTSMDATAVWRRQPEKGTEDLLAGWLRDYQLKYPRTRPKTMPGSRTKLGKHSSSNNKGHDSSHAKKSRQSAPDSHRKRKPSLHSGSDRAASESGTKRIKKHTIIFESHIKEPPEPASPVQVGQTDIKKEDSVAVEEIPQLKFPTPPTLDNLDELVPNLDLPAAPYVEPEVRTPPINFDWDNSDLGIFTSIGDLMRDPEFRQGRLEEVYQNKLEFHLFDKYIQNLATDVEPEPFASYRWLPSLDGDPEAQELHELTDHISKRHRGLL